MIRKSMLNKIEQFSEIQMNGAGLILEGGGLRGIFTAGILDYLLEKDIHFPYVIGVSMGACNGVSYVSKQHGRNLRIPMRFMGDPRYISMRNLFKHGSYFGMDFIFNEIPTAHDPFDFDTFEQSPQQFIAVAANCLTGEPAYFEKDHWNRDKMMAALSASSSLPFVAKIVDLEGQLYLDGGIADSIPFQKAMSDGVQKPVVVLTRPLGYRKTEGKSPMLSKIYYRKYPELVKMMQNRTAMYNSQVDEIEALEKEGKIFVIRPSAPIQIGRTEQNREKLQQSYDFGYKTMQEMEEALREWLK